MKESMARVKCRAAGLEYPSLKVIDYERWRAAWEQLKAGHFYVKLVPRYLGQGLGERCDVVIYHKAPARTREQRIAIAEGIRAKAAEWRQKRIEARERT